MVASARASIAESFDYSADDLDTDLNMSEQPPVFARGQIQVKRSDPFGRVCTQP